MSYSQSRNWVFTLNNYTEEELKDIETWTDKGVEGVGYGKEVGANGTPHLQGFLVMTKKSAMSTVKALNSRMHLERMKGKLTQSIAYCSKQDSLTIIGKGHRHSGIRGNGTLRVPWPFIRDRHHGPTSRQNFIFTDTMYRGTAEPEQKGKAYR